MITTRKITITIPSSWWAQSLLWLGFAVLGFFLGYWTSRPGIGALFTWIAIVGFLINTGLHLNQRGRPR